MLPWHHFRQEAFGKNLQFFSYKIAFLSFKTYLYQIFWLEFEISASELTPVPNFSSTGYNKRTWMLTWNDTKNSLMTAFLAPSNDVSEIFMDFERCCPRVAACQVWLQLDPKQMRNRGGTLSPPPPSLYGSKRPQSEQD